MVSTRQSKCSICWGDIGIDKVVMKTKGGHAHPLCFSQRALSRKNKGKK